MYVTVPSAKTGKENGLPSASPKMLLMKGPLGVRRKREDVSVQHSIGTLETSFNLLFTQWRKTGIKTIISLGDIF